jgi:hypothetical protein
MEAEIVNGTNPENALSRPSLADTVHERAAGGTKVIRH